MDEPTREFDPAVTSGARLWLGRLVVVASLLLGLAVLAFAWFFPGRVSAAQAPYGAALAALAGYGLVLERARQRTVQASTTAGTGLINGLLLLAGILVSPLLIWPLGHRHLGGFDHGALIDLAWRTYQGQRPFADFPSTTPIGFVLGCRYAFALFGVRWSALVLWQALFTGVTSAWLLSMFWSDRKRRALAVGLTVTLALCANVVGSYWWYNPATSALAALYAMAAYQLVCAPRSRRAALEYVLCLVLLASMKPNIAGVLLLGGSCALLTSRALRLRVLVYSALALVLWLGWMHAHGLAVSDILGGYASIAARGVSRKQFLQDISPAERVVALVTFFGTFLPFAWLTLRSRLSTPVRSLLGAMLLAALVGLLSNGEYKLVELPVLLVGYWIASSELNRATPPAESPTPKLARLLIPTLLPLLLLSLSATALTAGILRLRVRGIGQTAFYDVELDGRPLTSRFFAGMEPSHRLVSVEAELTQALAQFPAQRVFFGHRLQWAYACFGRPAPKGEPVWWHRGVSYGTHEEASLVTAWAKNQHDLVILLRFEDAPLPRALEALLYRNYYQQPGFRELVVLRPRRSAT